MNNQNSFCTSSRRETSSSNYILDTLKNIDRMQREALNTSGCVSCNDLMINNQVIYNTKPIRFVLCSGNTFEAIVGSDGASTVYFRIQEVKGQCVVLRLLTYSPDTQTFTCTNYQTILDTKCVSAIQCFPSINCSCCNDSLTL